MHHLVKQCICLIIGASLVITPCFASNLPDLGSPHALSRTQEKEFSKMFLAEVRRSVPVLHDNLINDYVRTLGSRLVSHADTKGKQFHFFVVEDNTINAFAGPGGYIGINSGLITLTTSESELAAVLAHEIAHVTQNHLGRMLARSKTNSLATLGMLAAAIALGMATNVGGNATAGMAAAAMAGNVQDLINFTRSNEEEADRMGMQTLYRSKFNPDSMPTIFEAMQRANFGFGDDTPVYLRTHPVTAVRIADAKNRVAQYQKRKYLSSQTYYLMREHLRVETFASALGAVKYYQGKLKKKRYQNKQAIEYGLALALQRNHKDKQAIAAIRPLTKQHPNQVIYQMALADILSDDKQLGSAVKILKHN